jgi:hypothetical protein
VRGLDPPEQHQNENDDQNRADETNAAMTVTVSIAAEAPAESAQQEDDKDNYKNKSQRHDFISICGTWKLSLSGLYYEPPKKAPASPAGASGISNRRGVDSSNTRQQS